MLCPECHAEYLDHIKECGDCNVSLTDACPIDIPIPEMTWSPLIPFATSIAGQHVQIYVPKTHFNKANGLVSSITGKTK